MIEPADFSFLDTVTLTERQQLESLVITTDANNEPLSLLFHEEWDFSYDRKFSQGSDVKTVSFIETSPRFRKDIQFVMGQIVLSNNGLAVHTMRGFVSDLGRIADCLGSTNWSLLSLEHDFRLFKSDLAKMNLSGSTVKQTATTLNKLYNLGLTNRYVSDLKAFASECVDPDKLDKKQHIALPEAMATKVFKVCIDTINRYYFCRKEIALGFSSYYEQRREFMALNPEFPVRKYHAEVGCKSAIQLKCGVTVKPCSDVIREIQISCLVTILGFSGVRLGEAKSFSPWSYQLKSYHDAKVPVLVGEITKSQEGGVAKPESWVTHPISDKALTLAYDTSAFAREHYVEMFKNDPVKLGEIESTFLNLSCHESVKSVVLSSTSVNSGFRKLMKKYKIVATEQDVIEFDLFNPMRKGELKVGGYLPKLTPHDFRRTFAVFLARNKLGNMMTLKHQYKHLNVIMTQWYANGYELGQMLDMSVDEELQSMIHEANVSVTTNALFEIYNSPKLAGIEGERIENERIKNGYRGSIYMSKADIERQVRSGSVSVVEHPLGYCFNPTCDRICSSGLSSTSCQHELITREKALQRLSLRERLINRFNALNDGKFQMANILTRIALEIEAIEAVLKKHEIPFNPFENKLKANRIAFEEV